jgi:SAM-dependent methyltransferase
MALSLVSLTICYPIKTAPVKNTPKHNLESVKALLDKVYDGISGFGIDAEDSENITRSGGSPVYGEITREGVDQIINDPDIKLREDDVFVDAGCGVGAFAAQMYLQGRVKKSVGIELSKKRHELAQKAKQRLADLGEIDSKRSLEFHLQDIAKADYDGATIVYMASTCFPDALMKKMTEKFDALVAKNYAGTKLSKRKLRSVGARRSKATEQKKRLWVLTLRPLVEPKYLKLVKEEKVPMTWSRDTTVYFYSAQ